MRATYPTLLQSLTVIAVSLSLCGPARAVGGDETAPPKPAITCEKGKVYDPKTRRCVDAQNSDVDDLYQGVRQAAYAGHYDTALELLALMPAEDDRRLTYLGFVHRKLGHAETSMDFYTRAIARNPGNLLARSYMGQGLVERGLIFRAEAELRAIRRHGGHGTWAEAALLRAIETGVTSDY